MPNLGRWDIVVFKVFLYSNATSAAGWSRALSSKVGVLALTQRLFQASGIKHLTDARKTGGPAVEHGHFGGGEMRRQRGHG